MIATLLWADSAYRVDFARPLDISIPLSPDGPRAWYVDKLTIEPVRTDQFTGSVSEGGSVNFRNISFNPHGHGTHTESLGHIDREVVSVNKTLTRYHFKARLITVKPELFTGGERPFQKPGDLYISQDQIHEALAGDDCEALVVRTLPNSGEKRSRNYANTNPAYFAPDALAYMRRQGITHLLTDLPSVDREQDGGALRAHRAFWYGENPHNRHCTITEFIFVPDTIPDGRYLLELQTAPFENDATPSRPVLYKLDSTA